MGMTLIRQRDDRVHRIFSEGQNKKKSGDEMFETKTNQLLVLSNVLSLIILVLTVIHHFTIKGELKDLKGE